MSQQTKQLLLAKNYQSRIKLSQACKEEIKWWINHVQEHNGKLLLTPSPDLMIESDASNLGWGAVCQEMKMGGPWSKEEKKLHINALELKAAHLALKSVAKNKTDILVHIKMDNITAVAHINKMGGTKSPILNQITKEIWEFCLEREITLTAEYLPGLMNTKADWESRHVKSSSQWKLNVLIFKQLNNVWGPILIDLFADRLDNQTPEYSS